MLDILFNLALVIALAVVVIVGLHLARSYTGADAAAGGLGALFAPKPGQRIGVVETAVVDGRRRLILIRRDDVEHLVMTGGTHDVVIETGIRRRQTGSGA